MPYNIEQEGSKYKVIVTSTGRVVGTHPSRAQAQAQLGALYANEPGLKKCMTCGCDDLGNDHHYISDVEKCSSCIDKGQGPCWDGYEYAGTKDQDGKTVPNCIPVKKADGYQPNAGMKAAARRALKWKDDGKATGAGTPVGWGRASDIVAGRSMSLDTVKRMYSFFSRHEVDKKGKDWDKPSHGKIMWNAWGGDAGYAWSRAIVNRENKIQKESAGAERLSGGPGFKIEYNVPDCQGGYAVVKAGSGQVIGCYTTKAHAEEHINAVAVNEPNLTKAIYAADPKTVAGTLQQGPQQDGDDEMNFWTGAFSPFVHRAVEGEPMVPTYNSPPQNDGKPSVGYGNSSSPKGKSNS